MSRQTDLSTEKLEIVKYSCSPVVYIFLGKRDRQNISHGSKLSEEI